VRTNPEFVLSAPNAGPVVQHMLGVALAAMVMPEALATKAAAVLIVCQCGDDAM
jgi:hypothetical protein